MWIYPGTARRGGGGVIEQGTGISNCFQYLKNKKVKEILDNVQKDCYNDIK